MKQKLTAAIAALISFFLFTDHLFAQQGMGVGNNNPLEMLDVTGAIKIGTDINNSNAAPTGGAGTIRFRAGQFEGWDGATWIPLGGGGGNSPFEVNSNLVQPNTSFVTYATDDFIFGSSSLDDNTNTDNDGRFFYDKSKGAFRAGLVTGDQWNDIKRGDQSFAAGYDVTASGDYAISLGERNRSTGIAAVSMGTQAYAYGDHSFAWGDHAQATALGAVALGSDVFATADYSMAVGNQATASGQYSAAIGQNAQATQVASFAIGSSVTASGENSLAVGYNSTSSGLRSIALGWHNTASGQQSLAIGHEAVSAGRYAFAIGQEVTAGGRGSLAFGSNSVAPSAYETVIGRFNDIYTPLSSTDWQPTDRLFSVGNGATGGARSNALTILKNGNTGIGTSTPSAKLHIDGSLRFVDGNQSNGYVLTTDGAGNATWQAANSGTDDQNLTGATLTGTTLQIDIENGSSASLNLSSLVDDADADASNELQTLSISGNDITLSNGGGTVSIPTQSELKDADGDTQVKVEENVDEDRIRFYTGGTERMIVDNSGRVGIGTSSPGSNPGSFAALDIRSDAANRTSIYQVSSQNGVPYHYFVRTGGTLASPLSVGPGAQVGGISAQIYNGVGFYESASIHMNTDGVVSGDSPGLIGFHTTPSGSTTGVRRMTIKNNGNVGIGINNPGQRLHVAGSIRMVDGNQQAGRILVSDANGTMVWTDPATISTSDDGDWTISGNDQYSTVSGNVGIGTTSPSVKLEVLNGDILIGSNSTGTSREITIYGSRTGGGTNLNTGTGFGILDFDNYDANGSASRYTGARIESQNEGIGSNDGDLRFYTSNNESLSEAMRIDENGNVGVGAVPDTKLHLSSTTTGDATGIKLTQNNANSLIYHNSDNDLVLRKAINANQLVLDDGGNIGVGTETPGDELHVEGSIRMVDGNEADGYVATSDANGTMVWENPRRAVNFIQQPNGTMGSTGSAWIDLADDVTKTIDVTAGDIISVWADCNIRFTGGSGNDDFLYKVRYAGCGSGDMREKHMRFDEDSGHDNWTPLSYADAMVAPCSGTLTFEFSVRRITGDDEWEAKNTMLIFRRN